MNRTRVIPEDQVLNLWKDGLDAPTIAKLLGKVEGTFFQKSSVLACIYRARKRGDPRAIRKHHGLPRA